MVVIVLAYMRCGMAFNLFCHAAVLSSCCGRVSILMFFNNTLNSQRQLEFEALQRETEMLTHQQKALQTELQQRESAMVQQQRQTLVDMGVLERPRAPGGVINQSFYLC